MGRWFIFIIGIIVGLGSIGVWQFFGYHSSAVHYHANLAVYINGQREPFTADTYYEGITNCYADEANEPKERTHLHGHVDDLVHIHAPAVTWGHFFQNLGWNLGTTYLQTRDKLLVTSSKVPLTYWLNGEQVDNPAGRLIGDQDKLLVSYGTTDKTKLQTQFNSIPGTAAQVDAAADPASCSGSSQTDWKTRLQHIFQ